MAKRVKICLDAGHYGKYNRSPVVPAYYESNMVWKLHLLLKKELERFGIEVITTRSSQAKDLDVVSRGAAARGCDLFISLHSNATGDPNVDRAVAIALLNDSRTQIDEKSQYIGAGLASVVAGVMATNDAPKVTTRRAGSDRDGDGQLNDNYYGVLHGCRSVGVPGIILEHSFHTNTRATEWLLQDANLAKLAAAEAGYLAQYFGLTKDKPAVKDPKQLYRVRKSWEDAASQLGAFETLEHAKKACSPGFTVYDWNGRAVYPVADPAVDVKLDPAEQFTSAVAGLYKVNSPDGVLNLRSGAAADKTLLEAMPQGSTFRCYGYHTGGWLYGVAESGEVGYCSQVYLKRA